MPHQYTVDACSQGDDRDKISIIDVVHDDHMYSYWTTPCVDWASVTDPPQVQLVLLLLDHPMCRLCFCYRSTPSSAYGPVTGPPQV